MKIGIAFKPGPPKETAAIARMADDAGCSYFGVLDNQMLWRDAYVSMAVAAMNSDRMKIGPWVTNPLTRHIAVTTNGMLTLQELSGGRAVLGLGIGDSALFTIGYKPETLANCKVAVQRVRALVQGKSYEDNGVKIHREQTAKVKRLPILWAAANPRSLEFGGRYADGLIISGFIDREYLDSALRTIEAGAKASHNQKVEPILQPGFSVSNDREKAREEARPYVTKGLIYEASKNIEGWSEEKMLELRKAYNYYKHLDKGHEAKRLVPDNMIEKKAVAGTPEDCIRTLENIRAMGIDSVVLMLMSEDKRRAVAELGKKIMPSFT